MRWQYCIAGGLPAIARTASAVSKTCETFISKPPARWMSRHNWFPEDRDERGLFLGQNTCDPAPRSADRYTLPGGIHDSGDRHRGRVGSVLLSGPGGWPGISS